MLDELWEARVRVPRPYTQIGHAILMEFVGTDDEAAVPLKDVRLAADDARRVYDEILEAIDAMLRRGIIHGDLSAFNILYDGEHPVIIDFPQAVRIATHNEPYELFRRDVENVQRSFERYGFEHHPGAHRTLADEIWERYYLPERSAVP